MLVGRHWVDLVDDQIESALLHDLVVVLLEVGQAFLVEGRQRLVEQRQLLRELRNLVDLAVEQR